MTHRTPGIDGEVKAPYHGEVEEKMTLPEAAPAGVAQTRDGMEAATAQDGDCLSCLTGLLGSCWDSFLSLLRSIGETLGLISAVQPQETQADRAETRAAEREREARPALTAEQLQRQSEIRQLKEFIRIYAAEQAGGTVGFNMVWQFHLLPGIVQDGVVNAILAQQEFKQFFDKKIRQEMFSRDHARELLLRKHMEEGPFVDVLNAQLALLRTHPRKADLEALGAFAQYLRNPSRNWDEQLGSEVLLKFYQLPEAVQKAVRDQVYSHPTYKNQIDETATSSALFAMAARAEPEKAFNAKAPAIQEAAKAKSAEFLRDATEEFIRTHMPNTWISAVSGEIERLRELTTVVE